MKPAVLLGASTLVWDSSFAALWGCVCVDLRLRASLAPNRPRSCAVHRVTKRGGLLSLPCGLQSLTPACCACRGAGMWQMAVEGRVSCNADGATPFSPSRSAHTAVRWRAERPSLSLDRCAAPWTEGSGQSRPSFLQDECCKTSKRCLLLKELRPIYPRRVTGWHCKITRELGYRTWRSGFRNQT